MSRKLKVSKRFKPIDRTCQMCGVKYIGYTTKSRFCYSCKLERNRRYRQINPWCMVLHRVKKRVRTSKWYKGIKCSITSKQIKELWLRDKASEMKWPSIDRIDSLGDYRFDNCRFIEFSDNLGNSRFGEYVYDRMKAADALVARLQLGICEHVATNELRAGCRLCDLALAEKTAEILKIKVKKLELRVKELELKIVHKVNRCGVCEREACICSSDDYLND